jgi:hypothetical protein
LILSFFLLLFLCCVLFIYLFTKKLKKSEFCWNYHHNLTKLQSDFFQIKIKIIGSINSNNDNNNNNNNNLKTTKSLFVRTAMSFCFLGHKFALILRTALLVVRSNRLFQLSHLCVAAKSIPSAGLHCKHLDSEVENDIWKLLRKAKRK